MKSFSKIGFGAFIFMVLVGNIVLFDPPKEEETIHSYTESAVERPAPVPTTKYISYDIPDGDTSFKSYMDYRSITNTESKQYRLQQNAYTNDYGLRIYDDMYMVAMGSYYVSEIGDIYRITLSNGTEFIAVAGDLKADRDTDMNNQYHPMENDMKNVVEFIVDTHELNSKVRQSGTVGTYNEFSGDIVKIERIERYE